MYIEFNKNEKINYRDPKIYYLKDGTPIGFKGLRNFECQTAAIRANSDNLNFQNVNFQKYCECLLELVCQNYTKKDLSEKGLSGLELDLFNGILKADLFSCANITNIEMKKSIEDVTFTGSPEKEIPVVNSMIKTNFGDRIVLFVFDTGADVVIINQKIERVLLKDKIPIEYTGNKQMLMADGTRANFKSAIVGNMNVYGFKVNNVEVVISENTNALNVLGNSFLNKFESWSFDNNRGVLTLRAKIN